MGLTPERDYLLDFVVLSAEPYLLLFVKIIFEPRIMECA